MSRNRKRKTTKGAGGRYTKEAFDRALHDVRMGNKTIHAAAVVNNIHYNTLKHHVRGTRGVKGCASSENKGGGGVPSYLPQKDEMEIAKCIQIMDKNGFGLSRKEVIEYVTMYIQLNNIKTRFKDNCPGSEWFRNFARRHGLSIKKPQTIEHARTDQANPWVVYDFFDTLINLVNTSNLHGKPHCIFNCDETSFGHDPSKTKSVGAIGTPSQRKTYSSGRENTSVLMCCSASGQKLPLLTVFKGKWVMDNWIEDQELDAVAVAASAKGWMETTLFTNWFQKIFLPNIGKDRPVLLIYDGHATHVSTDLINLAIQNDVHIMKLPPHTTHILQALDVAVFKGLKDRWDAELCKWQRRNPRKKISKSEFCRILHEVTNDLPEKSIINGFRSTGLYDPVLKGPNKAAIPEKKFKATDLMKYQEQQAAKNKLQVVSQLPQEQIVVTEATPNQLLQKQVVVTAGTSTAMLEVAAYVTVSSIPGKTPPLVRDSPSHILSQPTLKSLITDPGQSTSGTNTVAINLTPSNSGTKTLDTNCNSSACGTDPPSASVQPATSGKPSTVIVLTPSRSATRSSPRKRTPSKPQTPTSTPKKTSPSKSPPRRKLSFEELLLQSLTPKSSKSNEGAKRRRLIKNCEVITSKEFFEKKKEEERNQLEIKKKKEEAAAKRQARKAANLAKQAEAKKTYQSKKAKKRNEVEEESDSAKEDSDSAGDEEEENDGILSLQDMDDDSEIFSDEENREVSFDVGDFCLCKVYGKTLNSFRHYVGEVLSIEEGEYQVKFYKRHNQTFKFCPTEEESSILKEDIIAKLKKCVQAKSARFKDMNELSTNFNYLTNFTNELSEFTNIF